MNPELAARLEALEAERLRPVPPPPPAWNRNRIELAAATRHLPDDEKPLTPRERRAEFNHLREGGVSVKDATERLGISDDTARTYEQTRRSGGRA